MSKKILLTLIFCVFACCAMTIGGCNIIYKQNIQQGNAIEQDKLEQLKLGMTMNQVAYLMGTPAVRDPFHQDRWDYYYSFTIRGGEPLTRLVTLRFENAILSAMTGVDFDEQEAVVTVDPETMQEVPDVTDEEPVADEALEESLVQDEPAVATEPAEAAEQSESVAVEELPVLNSSFEEPVITAVETPEAQSSDLPEVADTITAVEADTASWLVQLGAFESRENAENLLARAQEAGFQVEITVQTVEYPGTRYLLRTTGYDSGSEAQQQLDMINSALQIEGFLIPPER